MTTRCPPPPMRLHQLLAVALLALLQACAGGPPPDVALQRFHALLHSGSEQFASGQLARAAQTYEQAEGIATLYDRRALRLQALFARGAVAALRAQEETARQAYAQALAEAQGLGDGHSAGVAQAGLAEVARRAGQWEAALQAYGAALAPAALRPHSTEHLQARMGRALVWQAQGQTAAALQELSALLAQARASASPLLPAVLANQAALLRDRGDVPAALAAAEEALALDRQAANLYGLAADLELLGGLYRLGQRNAQAQASWERALHIVQRTGQNEAAARLQRALAGLP